MERKKTVTPAPPAKSADQKPKWKKITRGVIYPFPGKRSTRVKPGEVVSATAEELVKVIDHFELVKPGTGIYADADPKKSKALKDPKEPKEPTEPKVPKRTAKPNASKTGKEAEVYELVPIGEGLYNVLSQAGKTMNDKGLSKEEAEKLKTELEAPSTEE